MEEKDLCRILRQDLSVGTDAFRDGLLMHCLSEVNVGAADGIELSDDEFEMLAAAGDPSAALGPNADDWGMVPHLLRT